MRKTLCTLMVLGAGMLQAAPVSLTLTPASGIVSGHPGDTVGWGFTLVNGLTDWISVTNVVLTGETNPSLGTFTDFMGPQGGPSPSFAVAPGGTWSETPFNNSLSQGVGSYLIASNPIVPNSDSGTILVNFDTFNADPTTPTAIQTEVGSTSATFLVNVTAATGTPEPGSALLLLSGCAWLIRRTAYRRT